MPGSRQAAHHKSKVLVLSSVELPLEGLDPGRPSPDYLKIVESFETDILDGRSYARVRNVLFDAIVKRVGLQVALGFMALGRLHEYDAVIATSDDIGLPLAALMKFTRRRTPLYVICQNINTRKPAFYLQRLKVGSAVRRFLIISETQMQLVQERYQLTPDQLYLLSWHIDHRYFTPEPAATVRRQLCSAGLASRDYATLVEATRDLDVDVVIDANSAWYQLETNVDRAPLHERVQLRRGQTTRELRQLYAESQFVVVPLLDVPYPVGYTVILEAMAMGKPVIVTRTAQHGDFIVEGWNGYYVAPGNPAELRERIQYLLDNPEEVQRLGANARRTVEERFTLDHFAERLQDVVQRTADGPLGVPSDPHRTPGRL